MARYLVTHAWQGVKVGDVIEREQLHPALVYSVQLINEEPAKKEANQEPKKPTKKG